MAMAPSTSSAAAARAATAPADEPRPVADRRTRRRERGRNSVFDTAVALFIEQGFENTTMDQIADRADVARATVFNYFPRKTTFLDEWTTQRRERAAAAVRDENLEGWSIDQILRRYMTEMARMSEETRDETVALMTASARWLNLLAHPALGDELGAFIEDAQRSGQVPGDTDPRQAGVLTAIAYFAVLTQWISEDPAPFDLETELLAMLDNILHGIYRPATSTPPRSSTRRTRR
jgi:AcrR family transcriptional regulator